MSEAGSPTQNAPIESFFGHFKNEVDYKKCNNFQELKDKINKYIHILLQYKQVPMEQKHVNTKRI